MNRITDLVRGPIALAVFLALVSIFALSLLLTGNDIIESKYSSFFKALSVGTLGTIGILPSLAFVIRHQINEFSQLN